MRVLVTGGAGFVGRHFCNALTARGDSVTCVDSLVSESAQHPETWADSNIVFVKDDCRNFFTNDSSQWDLVIHLAAVVGGRANMEKFPIAVAEDLAIDASFFVWITKNKESVGHVIYFSSSAAYPIEFQKNNEQKRSLREPMIDFETLGMPDLTYGWAKLTGEYLARVTAEKYGVKIACYRPFSGYGEDQDEVYPFIGILKRVLNKENPVQIWSDSVRDFVHIDDIVKGVLETYPKITDGRGINLGSGNATSFSELVATMCRLSGHDATIQVLDDQPKGVFWRVADPTVAKALGFNPTTTLEEGILKAIDRLH
jgi:GDP-L-fucose synthase